MHAGHCLVLTLLIWISTSRLRSAETCCMCCTRSAGKMRSGRNTVQTHSSSQTWSRSRNPSRPSAASKLNYYPRNETENLMRTSVFKKVPAKHVQGTVWQRAAAGTEASWLTAVWLPVGYVGFTLPGFKHVTPVDSHNRFVCILEISAGVRIKP